MSPLMSPAYVPSVVASLSQRYGGNGGLPMSPDREARMMLNEEQATEIGAEVYIYGYPLVTMAMTRRVMTNTADPVGLRSPWGNSPTPGSFRL